MKKVKILFFCMIFVDVSAFSQQISVQSNAVKAFSEYQFMKPVLTIPISVAKNLVSPSFYVENLSFFCKHELKIQSIIRIPVKFRLGTVQQCDWLEGKKNSGIVPPN